MQRFGEALRKNLSELLILGLSLSGGWTVFYATGNGPWGYSDSVSYIVSARNLLRGSGLGTFYPDGSFHWETHFPPFYPLTLAFFGAAGADLVSAARWLSLGLFVLTILGVGLLLRRFGSAPALALGGAFLVAIFPTMLNMFSSAMSEPLFICLCVWAIFGLLRYLENGGWFWFFESAILTGLLPLTRYVGIGVPVAMALALFLFQAGPWRTRLGRALLFGLLSNLMVLTWLVWVRTRLDNTVGGRVIVFSLAGLLAALKYFYVALIKFLWGWLPFANVLPGLPGNLKFGLIVLAAGLVIVLACRARRRNAGTRAAFRVLVIAGLFGLGYLLTLLIACIVANPRPDIDERMLVPVYLAVVLVLASAASIGGQALTGGRQVLLGGAALLLLLALFCSSDLPQDARLLASLRNNTTMTGEAWRNAGIMRAVRALPADATLISSASAEILVWADRPSYDFVETMGRTIIDGTGPYGSDRSNPVQSLFRKKGSILIVFTGVRAQVSRRFGASGDARLDSLLAGLDVYANYKNGIFYTYPQEAK